MMRTPCGIFLAWLFAASIAAAGEVELRRGQGAELPNDAFTVAMDIMPEPTRTGGKPGMVAYFGNGWDCGFRLRMSPKGHGFVPSLQISRGKGLGAFVLEAGEAIMPVGFKTHLASTWDGRTAKVYVNGRCVAEGSHARPLVRANGLVWGVGGPAAGLEGYTFKTAGVRLWDSALSADDIKALASGAFAADEREVASFVSVPFEKRLERYVAGTIDPRFAGMMMQSIFNSIVPGCGPRLDVPLPTSLLEAVAASVTNGDPVAAREFRLVLASAGLRDGDAAKAKAAYSRLWEESSAENASYASLAGAAYANVLEKTGDCASAAKVRSAAEALARPFLKYELRGEDVPPAAACTEQPPCRPAAAFHVALGGCDSADGSETSPFATFVRARDAVRELKKKGPLPAGGVAVMVHGGIYRMSETIELSEEDSGEPGAPVAWRAWRNERPVLTGAIEVPRFDAKPDPEVVRRLPSEARSHVVCADVRALGYLDTSPLSSYGYYRCRYRCRAGDARSMTDVYADGERLQLARFPDDGWLHVGEVLDKSKDKVFKADIDLVPWADEPSLMLTGYWEYLWADLTETPEKLDPAAGTVTLGKKFDLAVNPHRPWFIVNAIRALDRPGEWWLDRPNGKLYLWPPKGARRYAISFFDKPFLSLKGVRHFAIAGLVMERGRSAALMSSGCSDFHFTGNVVRDFGGEGAVFSNARNASIRGNVFRGFGHGAMRISGGDRKTLTSSGVVVSDNDISWVERWKRTYAPGIHLSGCGIEIAHNHLHDMLSSAMRIEGNDHHVVSNVVERVVTESDDQGGIDVWGNPTYAGVFIAFNLWRNIGCGGENVQCGQAGVRFDDAVSTMTVYCNRFENCSIGNFGCVQINGGRNNTIDNNVFVNSRFGVSGGGWGDEAWRAYFMRAKVDFWVNEETPIRKPPYSEKYPGIASLPEMGPENYITRNVVVGSGTLLRSGMAFGDSNGAVVYANRAFGTMPSAARLAEDPSFRPLPPETALGPRDVPSYRRACANDTML